jgi:hypothetical protein
MGKGQGASEKGGRLIARNQPRASLRYCDLGCEIAPRLGRELLGFIWAIGIQVIETPPIDFSAWYRITGIRVDAATHPPCSVGTEKYNLRCACAGPTSRSQLRTKDELPPPCG